MSTEATLRPGSVPLIRSAVTVSLVPEARGGPFVFWDDRPAACRQAQALGFDAIEVVPPAPDAIGRTCLAPGERGWVEDASLRAVLRGTLFDHCGVQKPCFKDRSL